MAWKSWDSLCCPKNVGRLGFKKAKNVNSALLAKLAWMIASKRDSLCMSILKAKYRVKEDWLRAEPPKFASPIWKAIEMAKPLVKKRACFFIGNGESVDMWLDPWAPWIQNFILAPRVESSAQIPIKVSHLIGHELHTWKSLLVLHLFTPSSAHAILSIPIPSRPRPDKLIWLLDSKQCFSVKSAFKELLPSPQP